MLQQRVDRIVLIGVVLLITAFGLLACSAPNQTSRNDVSAQEAKDLFHELVETTLQGDLDALCETAAAVSQCESELRNLSAERVPNEPPTISCIYPFENPSGGPAGQVLVVQGVDGKGDEFVTEVAVWHETDDFVATNTVWWSGMGFSPESPAETGPAPVNPEDRLTKCQQGSMDGDAEDRLRGDANRNPMALNPVYWVNG